MWCTPQGGACPTVLRYIRGVGVRTGCPPHVALGPCMSIRRAALPPPSSSQHLDQQVEIVWVFACCCCMAYNIKDGGNRSAGASPGPRLEAGESWGSDQLVESYGALLHMCTTPSYEALLHMCTTPKTGKAGQKGACRTCRSPPYTVWLQHARRTTCSAPRLDLHAFAYQVIAYACTLLSNVRPTRESINQPVRDSS